MKRRIIILSTIIMTLVSCNNPFLAEWDTPYGIPDFGKVKEKHYIQAVELGIRQQQSEIDAIIAESDAPDFENVVGAYEHSGAILDRVTGVLFNLAETDAGESLQKIVEQILPMLSEHNDNIFMNPYFFAKVDKLHSSVDELGLDPEQKMALKKLHRAFVKNGVALSAGDQARMREINKELSSLEYAFGNNLLAENNAFAEKFGIAVSEYGGKMASCEDRQLREQMFKAYASRGNNGNEYDNKELILKIMSLRVEKAKLLGYRHPADFFLSDKMAGNAKAVDKFLADLMKPAVRKAKEEIRDMQKIMDQDIEAGLLPEGSKICPWDWAYYAEKVRKDRYALDEEQLKPYFKMENVREGVFTTANRLFGLNFEKLDDVPVYHDEVEAFKVTDADGSLVGVLLTDYFPRSTKRGGAWMNNFVNQEVNVEGEDVRPVIVNVGNFSKPTQDKPSLLTLDEVETMFHEFGHALHGLLSKCTYKSVAGTNVARDFVELPSQIMENWAFQKEVLASYARHYETDEVIPDSLITKIQSVETFNQGFMTTELVAASILDLKWHMLDKMTEDVSFVEEFEAKTSKEMGLIDEIIPRYRTTYFAHIFSGGYSAGYYSYLWAEVLDKDAFELFKEKGLFDRESSMAFRRNILEKGGSEEPMLLYKRFRGSEPDPAALLRARGLK
ncbi:MAG: M3 family metallopeptidase [Bacteroidales bacterium]|nr:M3 family metallopeptidase [Bacteroidales bacterium]